MVKLLLVSGLIAATILVVIGSEHHGDEAGTLSLDAERASPRPQDGHAGAVTRESRVEAVANSEPLEQESGGEQASCQFPAAAGLHRGRLADAEEARLLANLRKLAEGQTLALNKVAAPSDFDSHVNILYHRVALREFELCQEKVLAGEYFVLGESEIPQPVPGDLQIVQFPYGAFQHEGEDVFVMVAVAPADDDRYAALKAEQSDLYRARADELTMQFNTLPYDERVSRIDRHCAAELEVQRLARESSGATRNRQAIQSLQKEMIRQAGFRVIVDRLSYTVNYR